MDNFSIRIGRSRSCFFTKTQKKKIESGIEIFMRALSHKSFEDNLLRFSWVDTNNKRFYRFHHASGLSNNQVLNRIRNYHNYFKDLGINEELVLLPFRTMKEVKTYTFTNSPLIWISPSCLNNNWFTCIHVASAIMHELTILLGLDNSIEKFSRPEYEIFKVPKFVGQTVLSVAAEWKHSVSDIREAFDQIDTSQYNYFPTSSIIRSTDNDALPNYQTSYDALISSLLMEQETLFALQDNLTASETARLICLEEVLLNLDKQKSKLKESSLDGSEYSFPDNKNVGMRKGSAGY